MTSSIVFPVYFGAMYPPDAYIDPILKEAVQYNLENAFKDQENFVFALRNQRDNICSWLIFPNEVFITFWESTQILRRQLLNGNMPQTTISLDKMGWIQILRDIKSQVHTYQILRLHSAAILNQMFRFTFYYEMEQVPIAYKSQDIDRYCSVEYMRQPDSAIEDIIEGLKKIDLKMQPIMMQHSTEKLELQVHDIDMTAGVQHAKMVFNRRKAVELLLGYDHALESDGFAYKKQPKNVRSLELYLDFPKITIEHLDQITT